MDKKNIDMSDKQKTEAAIQSESYVWFHNSFPCLRGCLCYNFNNPRNMVNGAHAKAMGLQKGRSDMVLYYNGTAFMFEFKDNKGRQQPNQKDWQEIIESQGFEYYIVRSKEQFIDLIKAIVGDPCSN